MKFKNQDGGRPTIMELLRHHTGPPTKSLPWATSDQPVKFCGNRVHSFEDMGFDFFAELA